MAGTPGLLAVVGLAAAMTADVQEPSAVSLLGVGQRPQALPFPPLLFLPINMYDILDSVYPGLDVKPLRLVYELVNYTFMLQHSSVDHVTEIGKTEAFKIIYINMKYIYK